MSFDPEMFGQAMGEAIQKAIAPFESRINALQKSLDEARAESLRLSEQVKSAPVPKDGKDADEDAIAARITADFEDRFKQMCDDWLLGVKDELKAPELPDIKGLVNASVQEAMSAIPKPMDGKSITVEDVRPVIEDQVKRAVDSIPAAKDGVGVAGAMIDRDDCLLLTLTNGEVKNLGRVVGSDGLSMESFELDYLPDSHEVSLKASCAGRVKELRYPAGGIRPAGYWRDGKVAKSGEAWVHDGSTWIATKDTSEKPDTKSDAWIIAARKGRDGEPSARKANSGPSNPIKLGD